MKTPGLLLSASLLLSLGSTAAFADTFNFSFGTSSDAFYGSGVLTGTLTSPGVYTITGVTGTTNTGGAANRTITGIDAPFTFEVNDNLLDDVNGVYNFDALGLSYVLSNGAQINISNSFGTDLEILERANGNLVFETVPYSISATPEPGSLLLMGTGLLGGLGVMRRRLFA